MCQDQTKTGLNIHGQLFLLTKIILSLYFLTHCDKAYFTAYINGNKEQAEVHSLLSIEAEESPVRQASGHMVTVGGG